jgi:ankyrin repeat protein
LYDKSILEPELMKKLLNFALFTMAIIRSVSSGKTLVVSNFPKTAEKEEFSNYFSSFFEKNPDKVTHIANPLDINQILLELSSAKYDTIVVNTHGIESEVPMPIMNINLEASIALNDILEKINSAENAILNQIHLSSCFIGKNVNQLLNPQSYYYCELNQNLQNNQLLFLHGDEYTGSIAKSYGDRLPHLITNKEYSIIEAFLDSGEGLNVIFKKDDQLKVFVAKTFGRNGEEWTLENYRSYLRQVADDAKKFEVRNDILSADAKRPDIKNLSDEELTKSMGDIFTNYFTKVLDKEDFDRAFQLIDKGAKLGLQNKDGWTALMFAIDKGHSNVAQSLIDKGAGLDIQNKEGYTALMFAIDKGHSDVARSLIDEGAGLDLQNKDGWTALMFAIYKGHSDVARSLIDKGAKLDLQNKDCWMALMIAIDKGHSDVAQSLINKGAGLDIQKQDGWTALMFAIDKGHSDVAQSLIDKGAKLDLQNKDGYTALMFAIYEGHSDVAQSLINKGAGLDIQKQEGWTALMFAIDKGHSDVAQFLIDEGAGLDLQNKEGWTALMFAIYEGHSNVAQSLINKGAGLDIQKQDGCTALMFAIDKGHSDVAQSLIGKGAKLDLQNKDGWTALMFAIYKGHSDVARSLIDEGARLDLQKQDGWTALMFAIYKGHSDVAQSLINKGIEVKLTQEFLAKSFTVALQKDIVDAKQLNFLLELGVEINSLGTKENSEFLDRQDSEGYSLLMCAAQEGYTKLANLLLKSGASIGLTNKKGESAYKIAKENQHEEIAKEIKTVHENTGEDYHPEILPSVLAAAEGHIFIEPLVHTNTKNNSILSH